MEVNGKRVDADYPILAGHAGWKYLAFVLLPVLFICTLCQNWRIEKIEKMVSRISVLLFCIMKPLIGQKLGLWEFGLWLKALHERGQAIKFKLSPDYTRTLPPLHLSITHQPPPPYISPSGILLSLLPIFTLLPLRVPILPSISPLPWSLPSPF